MALFPIRSSLAVKLSGECDECVKNPKLFWPLDAGHAEYWGRKARNL